MTKGYLYSYKEEIVIFQAEAKPSSKDFSVTSIDEAELTNVTNCYEAAQKKQEFGGSKLIIKNLDCSAKSIVDDNSQVLIGEL